MYSVSAKYLSQIRQTHNFFAYADLYYNGALVQSMVGVIDGTINVNRTQNIRRSGNITLSDASLFNQFVQSPLAPFGAEMKVYYGIRYNDGTTEVVPIGVFSLETTTLEESFSQQYAGSPMVTLNDRSIVLQRDKFTVPADYSGWTGSAAIQSLIAAVLPNVSVTFSSELVDFVLPGSTVFNSTDRLSAVGSICTAMGAEMYFDVLGNAQVVPIPILTQDTSFADSVWAIDASTPAAQSAGASPYGVLVTANRGTTRTGVVNAIAVYGNASGTAAQPFGIAYDLDARSPTYWNGSFGHVTDVINSSVVTSDAQAQAAAQAALMNALGNARSLAFTIVPNAALEAGDILTAVFSDGTRELHILDAFAIPLNPANGTFTGNTRTLTYQTAAGQ